MSNLNVFEFNQPALAFYRTLGYETHAPDGQESAGRRFVISPV